MIHCCNQVEQPIYFVKFNYLVWLFVYYAIMCHTHIVYYVLNNNFFLSLPPFPRTFVVLKSRNERMLLIYGDDISYIRCTDSEDETDQ